MNLTYMPLLRKDVLQLKAVHTVTKQYADTV